MSKKPTLKSLQSQVDELTLSLQRSHAELVNYKRRTEEERAQLMTTAKISVIKDLLSVIDNLSLALGHQPKELKDNTWAKGVVSVAKQLDDSLARMGVVKIDSKPGTLFDPALHEAVVMEEGKGTKEVVSEEMRAGYRADNQVIRPAMVKVTTKQHKFL